MPTDKPVKLTNRQREVLNLILRWIADAGYPPTRRDIAEHFNFRSPNASEEHLKALERKGVIKVLQNTSRGIRVAQEYLEQRLSIPVVGRVAAGSPILAEEHIDRALEIPSSMFSPSADYFLTVQGDSMMRAGILDGDLLAVHKTTEVRNNQIVVARIDDEVTVKRFFRQDNSPRVQLMPEHPAYDPIEVDLGSSRFAIEGIKVGLVRLN